MPTLLGTHSRSLCQPGGLQHGQKRINGPPKRMVGGRGEADDDAVRVRNLGARERMTHDRQALQRDSGLPGSSHHRELAQVIAMAVTINAWNRINVTVRTAVPRR